MTFTIHGAPRTKKNHGRIVRNGSRPRLLPSVAFLDWQTIALAQLHSALRHAPYSEPVEVRAIFYRDANRGDLVGYMQALADVLEAAGVVDDDKRIESWDGTRMSKDAQRPRVEVEIRKLGA